MEDKYMDVSLSPEERAKALCSLLSKEEKMAQLQNFELNYDDAVRNDFYSEVGIGFLSAEWMQDCDSIEEAAEKQRALQRRAIELSPHHIPAFFYTHGIAGAHLPEATTFPSDLNRGSNFNTRLETRIGEIVGKQALALGISHILTPVMDISRDYYVERLKKTYGQARALGVIMGGSYIHGVKSVEVDGRKAEVITDTEVINWDALDETEAERVCLFLLTEKFRLGLFEHPYALEGEELQKHFNNQEDYEVSRSAAEESITLLKNDGILPFDRRKTRIALIGPHAEDAFSYFMNKKSYHSNTSSLLDKMRAKRPEESVLYSRGYGYEGDEADEYEYEKALKIIKEADAVVLTLGMRYEYWDHEMGGLDIKEKCGKLPYVQEEFIRRAKELGVPMVGVHFGVHPCASAIAPTYLDAVVEALLPAEGTADAVYDVLSGKVNPGGRLPLEVFDDETHELRLPFGHGLSFCDFSINNLSSNKSQIHGSEKFEISLDLKNNGPIAGNELIQLYLREENKEERDNRKLIGLRKVFFLSGEGRKVVFEVDPAQVALPNEEQNGKWEVHPGKYTFDIGKSVRDIIGTVEVEILDREYIEGPERVFYSTSRVE